MIPKKIHYIWLGRNEKNERIKHCIESWKKYLPDYEIIEWNEDNLPMEYNNFFKQSYEHKKWAFASDVARLWVLYKEGGIYMDTDVEIYKPIDEFLNNEGFIGFEDTHYLSTATIGSIANNPIIKTILDFYDCIDFKKYDDWKDYITYQETSPCIYSNIFGILGLDRDADKEQHIKHFSIYPRSYFHTQNEGYAYHSWNGSW